jgi:hypothetical protein
MRIYKRQLRVAGYELREKMQDARVWQENTQILSFPLVGNLLLKPRKIPDKPE